MKFLTSVDSLHQLLEDKEPVVVIDARFDLGDATYGKRVYEEGHIPGAVHLDLKDDLSGEVKKHGGSHPLPPIEAFVEKLSSIGIDHETTVVVYDDANDMYAARAWWMIHYVGHEHVYVLDGGFKRWKEAGYQVTTETPTLIPKQFTPRPLDIVVHMEEVKEKMNDSSAILIDSRARERYLGKTEPLYKKSGHIPGAKNYFWKDVLNEDGFWKSVKELQEHFSSLRKNEEIIVSCGSGVSACPNFIGLTLAGYDNVKLYPGSFSDWISYEENTLETKEE